MRKNKLSWLFIAVVFAVAITMTGCQKNNQGTRAKDATISKKDSSSESIHDIKHPVELRVDKLRVTTDDNGIAIIKGKVKGKGKLFQGQENKKVAKDGNFVIKYDYDYLDSGEFNEDPVFLSYESDKDEDNFDSKTVTVIPSESYKEKKKNEILQSESRSKSESISVSSESASRSLEEKQSEDNSEYITTSPSTSTRGSVESAEDNVNKLGQDTIGSDLVDSIDSDVSNVYQVNLNSVIGSGTNMQMKDLVSQINITLYNELSNNGSENPKFNYYLSGLKIGENKVILNPSEVKFEDD
ncbi:hypothetical protein [Lapidilactobacillus dextrinicus]|uniref:hypothetical protein n=1 Tax=Lapidilactobacillus dextrinicus TaxID=51664 RepID=UPI0022E15B71|nr:hypothetical protein [Lapidilactobacillus dextrinicus]